MDIDLKNIVDELEEIVDKADRLHPKEYAALCEEGISEEEFIARLQKLLSDRVKNERSE